MTTATSTLNECFTNTVPRSADISRVAIAEWSDPSSWDAFVEASSQGTVCHLFGWRSVVEQAYGQRGCYLAAHDAGGVCGVLPLVLTRSPIFGRHLTSMPYLDSGGILADDSRVAAALLLRAQELCRRARARLNLRYRLPPQLDLPADTSRAAMQLELAAEVDQQWAALPGQRRNRIRKGLNQGLTTSVEGIDQLGEFYRVFAENMRDLGSPVHGLAFFRQILLRFGDRARLLVVRDGDTTIGAALCLLFRDTISVPWVSSLRSHFNKCPNQVLYWGVMQLGIERGFRFLDFGRSAKGDGTFEAKRQWGAVPVQLYWVTEQQPALRCGPSAGKPGLAVAAWQRLPLPLATAIGPWIRKGLPS